MARKKSTVTIDTEITKIKEEMAKLAAKLQKLEEEKINLEKDAIIDAYKKSGKSFDELLEFLKPGSKKSIPVEDELNKIESED